MPEQYCLFMEMSDPYPLIVDYNEDFQELLTRVESQIEVIGVEDFRIWNPLPPLREIREIVEINVRLACFFPYWVSTSIVEWFLKHEQLRPAGVYELLTLYMKYPKVFSCLPSPYPDIGPAIVALGSVLKPYSIMPRRTSLKWNVAPQLGAPSGDKTRPVLVFGDYEERFWEPKFYHFLAISHIN